MISYRYTTEITSANLRLSQPSRRQKIELREDLKSRRGLAVSLEIICHNCGESTSTMSSKISNKCYDVNLRLTYGMRAIEKVELLLEYSVGLFCLHHLQKAKVYGDTEVEKLECVGHVQKAMGTRLRNILKMSKGIKLSDGKNISGRGRLTLKEVDSIQHYYGLAIRKNLSSVEDMKRAIWAIYFHKLSTEDNPQHALCPLEKDLLKKCLHGGTQNPNESFNKCIWERIPKTVFVGIETLKFGVTDAVICFNDGYVSRIKVFEALGIKPGYNTERALLIIDNKRIF
ncbi:uncharacterized protein TNCV_274121 [Trichonephila clavipes]|nr:uncharacterized protein TNCV_274121 [Trichonephila clavipes]